MNRIIADLNSVDRSTIRVMTVDKAISSQLVECAICKIDKPIADFYPDKFSRNGLRSKCKKCQIAQNSSPKELERKKLYNRKMRRENPQLRMYDAAKCKAKKRGIPFSITIDDIYIPKVCPVFGVPLKVSEKYPDHDSPSLDRIKPELGYVPSNICVICDRANRAKKDATVEELEAVVKYMKRHK